MYDYNERMLKAKQNLDQRLAVKKDGREDGEKCAVNYFFLHQEKILKKILDRIIDDMEEQNQLKTSFQATYAEQIFGYFSKNKEYRNGFKAKLVDLLIEKISDIIPDFKGYISVKIEEYDGLKSGIIITVKLQF